LGIRPNFHYLYGTGEGSIEIDNNIYSGRDISVDHISSNDTPPMDTSIPDDPTEPDDPETGNSEVARLILHDILLTYREAHLSVLQKLKSDRTADNAFDAVWNNNANIQLFADNLAVPREMMQALIFKEQICIGIEDALADQLVKQGTNDDNSTGLGRIFARTAMAADNYINGALNDPNNALHVNTT